MKVYIAYECHYNGCDVFRHPVKVFDDEVKALVWSEDYPNNDQEWRSYEAFELE